MDLQLPPDVGLSPAFQFVGFQLSYLDELDLSFVATVFNFLCESFSLAGGRKPEHSIGLSGHGCPSNHLYWIICLLVYDGQLSGNRAHSDPCSGKMESLFSWIQLR